MAFSEYMNFKTFCILWLKTPWPKFWLKRLRLKKKNFRERHQAAALLITYLPVWFRMFSWIDMLNRHPRQSQFLLLLQLCFLLLHIVTSQFADELGNSGKRKKLVKILIKNQKLLKSEIFYFLFFQRIVKSNYFM